MFHLKKVIHQSLKKRTSILILSLFFIMTVTLIPGGANAAAPSQSVKVIFNGLPYVPEADRDKAQPYLQQGNTMVPVRATAENLGFQLAWDSASQRIILQRENIRFTFKKDSSIAEVNGRQVQMPAPVRMKRGFSYLPLRFISEQLDLTMTWRPEQQEIAVTYHPKPEKTAKFEPKNGTYLGAYILSDSVVNGDISAFNQITGKKHATFFMYLGYGEPFPTKWVEEVKRAGAFPQIAFEPNDGLDKVKDDEYLRNWARAAKASGVPILLRYASEMNGDWSAYSGDPAKFIEKWRLVHDVMKEEAPNVAMMWSVFTFPQSNIRSYYPGKEYVDWVGVNVYNVVYHNDDIKHVATDEDPLELIRYVYNTYSHDHPIAISEYGATHLTRTDNFVDHSQYAVEKITRLYGKIHEAFPRIKAVYYYDVNNLKYAPEGRKINDYSLTNHPDVLNAYRRVIASDHYLSSLEQQTGQ
jgi:hypothetical protein